MFPLSKREQKYIVVTIGMNRRSTLRHSCLSSTESALVEQVV